MTTKISFLPDEHHFALANVIVRSAEIENVMERLVYLQLRQPDDVTRFLLKNLNPSKIADLLKTIFIAHIGDHKADIENLFDRISKCRTDRNELFHWLYSESPNDGKVWLADKRPYRSPSPREMTAQDIQAIANAMHECVAELVEWMSYCDWYLEVSSHDTHGPLLPPPHLVLPSRLRPKGI